MKVERIEEGLGIQAGVWRKVRLALSKKRPNPNPSTTQMPPSRDPKMHADMHSPVLNNIHRIEVSFHKT